MNELQKKISEIGVVPVIKLSNPQRDAKPLADALCAGGVPVAEVTFRAAGAADAIRIMAEAHPEMLVGAGTVTTPELVEIAVNAGAKYIISPDPNPEVIKKTRELGLVSMPGAYTATEAKQAHNAGADFVKLQQLQDELAELEAILNTNLDNIMARLRAELPYLKEKDYAFLAYLYARFSGKTIATFMKLERNHIYQIKHRLRDEIKSSDAPSREFFLENMV